MKPDEALETAQDQLTPFDPSLYHSLAEPLEVTRSQYDDETRRTVVALYLQYGNATKVASLAKIPKRTILDWVRADWWESVAASVRAMVTNETRGKLQAIITQGLDSTLDRLTNGEEISTKDGIRIVKVKGKDAAVITSIMIDKLQASLQAPTLARVDGKVEVLADQLERLSAQVNARTVSSQ